MLAGRVPEVGDPGAKHTRNPANPIGRSPAAELGRVQCEALEILGAATPSSVFVHEVVHKNTFECESGEAGCEVTTVISWLGGGCGGHRWVLGKPAAMISTHDLQEVLDRQSGGCRHG